MRRRISLLAACALLLLSLSTATAAETCPPTEPDMQGPFYKPNAPERSKVGSGYVLQGVVKSTTDCAPLARARIEFWMAGPDGDYADAYRATIITDTAGAYRFESSLPPPYYGRPPHIHIRVSAPGYKTLVTQHYPKKGRAADVFDLVLVPAR